MGKPGSNCSHLTEAFGFGEAPLAGTGRYVRLTFTGARNYCLGTPVVAGIRDIGIYGGPSNLALTLTDSAEQPISALALQDGWPTRNAASGALANPIRVTAVVNDQTATGGEYTLIIRIASTQGTARFYAYDFPMVEQGCMVRDVEPYGDGVNLNSFVQQTIACTPHCI